MLLMNITTVLANDFEKLNKQVLNNFNKEFATAKNIQWTSAKSFLKVSFTLDGQSLFAYYSESGERVATGRHVSMTTLPMSLAADLKNSYSNYWITEAFELVSNEGNAYYLAVESADFKITLKSSGLEGWSILKRTSKN